MKESRIESAACSRIRSKLGIESLKLNVKANTAYPDRLFWLPGGKPILIEFKVPGEELRPKQEYICSQLRLLGYDVRVCDSAKQAEAIIELELIKRGFRSCTKNLSLLSPDRGTRGSTRKKH